MRFLNVFSIISLAASAAPPPAAAEEQPAARGIVRAVSEAWLSSDLGLPIVALPFVEGDSFAAGQILLAFDCASLKSDLKAAKARLLEQEVSLKNTKQLRDHNAAGQFELDIAKAKVGQAEAEAEGLAATVARCEMKAPFDGRIAQLGVNLHESPERGAKVMQIVDNTSLEVDMILPSDWLKWLEKGAAFEIAIDEMGTAAQAEVSRIAPVVDPISQTVKVVGRLIGGTNGVLPGMSGPVSFKVPNG